MRNRVLSFTLAFLVIFIVGVAGLLIFEPEASLLDDCLWTLVSIFTLGYLPEFPMTTEASRIFQSLFMGPSTALMVAIGAILVAPFWEWWQKPIKGLGKVRSGKNIILLNAIDWEKVASIRAELPKRFRLVALSNTLPDIPDEIWNSGVEFVLGNLRSNATYDRGGIQNALGAIICPPTYCNANVADFSTSAYALKVEGERKSIITIAEGISVENLDLFKDRGHKVDNICWFDQLTMVAVIKRAECLLNGRPAKITFKAFDEDQKREFLNQLRDSSITQSDKGVLVEFVLPSDLDNPEGSDLKTLGDMKRSRSDIIIGLYLSIKSTDLFEGREAICADRVMAKALVSALISKID